MLLNMCKAKIAHARVTETELYYEGSVTVPGDVLESVGILAGEKVEVLNLNNGSRLETYAIAGAPGSGGICLNGPAARCGYIGDKIILLSYALMEPSEAAGYKTRVVYLDDENRIKRRTETDNTRA